MLANEPILDGDSPLHCSTEWHLVRLKGKGARLAPLIYSVSLRLTGESERFTCSMRRLSPYFNAHEQELYAAARLLVGAGFWVVLEEGLGKPTQYRPVLHRQWAERHPNQCCEKFVMFGAEDGDPLGPRLFGVTGGKEFYPNVLAGYRKKSGLTDDAIVERANVFMGTEEARRSARGKGPAFRKALGSFLCAK
jgi:hypothetical protein